MRVPGGFAFWREWLAGKALPLTVFTLFTIEDGLALSRAAAALAHGGIRLDLALELLRRCLTLGFLLLIVAAYITRTRPVVRARGFWEQGFPVLVLLATVGGLTFLVRNDMPYRPDLFGVGVALTLLGYGMSLWAVWHLRRSFAIMAEVRQPVTSGPYRFVRHPLYLGETLTMLGLCLMAATVTSMLFWALFTGLQLTRACIEEAKLARQLTAYRAYRERTRFILPGLYKVDRSSPVRERAAGQGDGIEQR